MWRDDILGLTDPLSGTPQPFSVVSPFADSTVAPGLAASAPFGALAAEFVD